MMLNDILNFQKVTLTSGNDHSGHNLTSKISLASFVSYML